MLFYILRENEREDKSEKSNECDMIDKYEEIHGE